MTNEGNVERTVGSSKETQTNQENAAVSNCTMCGLCRTACPCYNILLNESISPRGKATILKEGFPSKHIYLCTLCKACENACILNDINLVEKIRDFRQELVSLGVTTEVNKKMIENVRKFGNPLGEVNDSNRKKIDLFCC